MKRIVNLALILVLVGLASAGVTGVLVDSADLYEQQVELHQDIADYDFADLSGDLWDNPDLSLDEKTTASDGATEPADQSGSTAGETAAPGGATSTGGLLGKLTATIEGAQGNSSKEPASQGAPSQQTASQGASSKQTASSEPVATVSTAEAGSSLSGMPAQSAWRFGDQLEGTARSVYDAMVQAYVVQGDPAPLSVALAQPVTFDATVQDRQIVRDDAYEAAQAQVSLAVSMASEALRRDYPQVFWLGDIASEWRVSVNYGQGRIDQVDLTVQPAFAGAADPQAIADFQQAYATWLEGIVSQVDPDAPRYWKLRYVHDALADALWYDSTSNPEVYTIWPVVMGDGGVVCEGYSEAFKAVCDALGIPCAIISGEATNTFGETESHGWDMVQMEDGAWYLVDVTWDDQAYGLEATYFLAGSSTVGFSGATVGEEREASGAFWDNGSHLLFSDYFQVPQLSTTAYVG